jgi:hypothetical protein
MILDYDWTKYIQACAIGRADFDANTGGMIGAFPRKCKGVVSGSRSEVLIRSKRNELLDISLVPK